MIHFLDSTVSSLLYVLCAFCVFFLGKVVHDLLNRGYKLGEELVRKDNYALGIAMAGYYLGLILAIGGAIVGPSHGVVDDVIDIFFYGILSVILLNVSALINDRVILYAFRNQKEIIEDQNCGTGAVVCAMYVATGMMLLGAVSGEGGDLITALVFWGTGQGILVVAGLVYNLITPYDVHAEIERDNVAAGVGFAGALLAIGNVIRWAASGDFTSWGENLPVFIGYAMLGILLLPLVRLFADRILLPGARLTAEIVDQERPNLGAALIEASSYLGVSFLLTWCL